MLVIVGVLFVLGTVFGGYVWAGGKFGIILHALPYEMTMLMGGAIGAMIVGNKGLVLKSVGKAFVKALKGAKWKEQDYKDMLCLLFVLCKLMKSKGMIAVEQHIEKPEESPIFNQYSKIVHDHFAIDLICDTLRAMTMGMEDPHLVEDIIEKKLEKHHHEEAKASHALQGMADGLPAIGIVVAVLGVVKTMASLTEPPEILGAMIGGALVGTFLGVFMAYCIVGPVANKVVQANDEDHTMYMIIRDVLVAHLKGMAPIVSMEIGRGNIPSHYQPTFAEMEEASNNAKLEGGPAA